MVPQTRLRASLSSCGRLIGVDETREIHSNDGLDSAHLRNDDSYPFPSETVDACASDYVIEHITGPVSHHMEVRRVLKSNGAYVFRTPNRFHYATVAVQLRSTGFTI